uniref:Uncharacterized protein n=1 Tax=Trichuris muris TaxID=70415 RepID=A0A5S6Q825_TRIMR
MKQWAMLALKEVNAFEMLSKLLLSYLAACGSSYATHKDIRSTKSSDGEGIMSTDERWLADVQTCGSSYVTQKDMTRAKSLDREGLRAQDENWLADTQTEYKDKPHDHPTPQDIAEQVRCGRSKDTPCLLGIDSDPMEPKARYKRGFVKWIKRKWSQVRKGVGKAWSSIRKHIPKKANPCNRRVRPSWHHATVIRKFKFQIVHP